MQPFLSIVKVIPGPINYKHFISSKNDGFNNFCDWYEPTSHNTTLLVTLFKVQIENNDDNEKLCSIRPLHGKLLEHCGAEGRY